VISKKELEIGTKIEKEEHGYSNIISRKIATDHIKEFPKYYTDKKYGLIAIEKKMKKVDFYGPYNTRINVNNFIGKMLPAVLLLFLPFKFIFLLF